MRTLCSRVSTVSALAVFSFVSAANAGIVYTPLAFGPLTDPGGSRYYTQVQDISADGRSYIGALNDSTTRFVSNGNTYTLSGTGGPLGISGDGQTVVGGVSGQTPQRWNLADLVGTNIASHDIDGAAAAFVNAPAYGANANATAFSISTPTGVMDGTGFHRANDAFTAIDPQGFAGANRGIAANAPIAVLLGHLPSETTNTYRWNYMTGDVSPLRLPGSATSMSVGGVGTAISGDGSIVGGSTSPNGSIAAPHYWDAQGAPHATATVGSRIWGSINAVSYTGTLMGGNLFGPGLASHAFIFDPASETSYDLNDLFMEFIPAGWILTSTTHISDDGSRIFANALAPNGSARTVVLDGDFVPAPATAAIFAMGGIAAARRRRD